MLPHINVIRENIFVYELNAFAGVVMFETEQRSAFLSGLLHRILSPTDEMNEKLL